MFLAHISPTITTLLLTAEQCRCQRRIGHGWKQTVVSKQIVKSCVLVSFSRNRTSSMLMSRSGNIDNVVYFVYRKEGFQQKFPQNVQQVLFPVRIGLRPMLTVRKILQQNKTHREFCETLSLSIQNFPQNTWPVL